MVFKPSRCVSLQTPNPQAAFDWYQRVFGLGGKQRGEEMELEASPLRLFCDEGPPAVVFELIVEDAESARDHLLGHSGQVLRWEGSHGRCYVRDAYGYLWNLHEDRVESALPPEPPDQPRTAREVRFTNCFAFGVGPGKAHEAAGYYREALGFGLRKVSAEWVELEAGPLRLFLCEDEDHGPIGAIDVRDRDSMRERLELEGCQVVRWEPEKCCTFMRDPHGFVFDVFEDESAFVAPSPAAP